MIVRWAGTKVVAVTGPTKLARHHQSVTVGHRIGAEFDECTTKSRLSELSASRYILRASYTGRPALLVYTSVGGSTVTVDN